MRSIRSQTMTLAAVLLLGPGIAVSAQAQSVITGRVTSEQGVTLQGANVFITELQISVGTNANGVYTITVPQARVSGQTVQLRARSVGFVPTARPITLSTGSQTVNFELKNDVLRLSEIVVTGVTEGTERAKVPFAIGRVTEKDLPVPALDPIRALAGKVAGLRIAQTSGRPGSTPEIMLRGPTSINAAGRGQGPLIIVDGAILNNGSLQEIGGLDIESVEVVKGAAGASLYGTRAAAGVITITTKRGNNASDGVKFDVRSEAGISDLNSIRYGMPLNHQLTLDETGTRFCVAGTSNIAACSRTVEWGKEIARINNVAADTTRTPQALQGNNVAVGDGTLQNLYQAAIWPGQYYNPLAQVLQRNLVTLNSLNATGKVAGVRFNASGQYQDDQGAIRGLNGNQQRRARVNLDYDPRKDLTVSLSSLYNRGTNDARSGGSSNGGIWGQVLRGVAIGTDFAARDTLGRYYVRSGGAFLRSPTGNGGGTILYDSENLSSTTESDRFLGSITTRYNPLTWFGLEGTFAYDDRSSENKNYLVKGYRTFAISTSSNNGQVNFSNNRETSMNGSMQATFRKQLLSDLSSKLTFRGQFDDYEGFSNGSGAEVLTVANIYTTSNSTQNRYATSSSSQIKNVGYVGALNLDYKDRYTLEGYLRRDGSSLFGQQNRYATYGRVSGVWQFSKEPFYNVGFIDDARLRASYGTAGNPPRFSAQYEVYNISSAGVISLGQAGNSLLKPEVTAEAEVGLDFTLFDRLGVELTHARGETKNQILPVTTPASLGFTTQWQNAGTLQNRTFEVALNLPIVQKQDVSWSVRGTWDRTRTYITELFTPEFFNDAGTGQGTGTAFLYTARTDKNNGFQVNRLGNIWGRKFYRTCGDLPASVQSQCGEGQAFQRNDNGYVVWVGEGNSWRDGITKNLWQTNLSGVNSPWGNNVPLYFGHPIVDRPLRGQPNQGIGINQIIGNTLPDFRSQLSSNFSYKRVTLYGLFDGTFGHDIINQGEGWGLLDLGSGYFDMGNRTVESAKPVGYSWRSGPSESTGTGGFYDTLNPNNYVTEDGSYVKLREVSLSYHVGRVRGVGDFTFSLIGRNLLTITNYSGLDPEVGATGGNNTTGSGLINQTDAYGFPTLRQFTFGISTRF